MIHQDCPFDPIDNCRKTEWIRLSLTGQRAHDEQTTGAVVALIGQYQCRTAMGLLTPHLWIEIQPDDVARVRDIAGYHSTISFPTSGPQSISSSRFSGVICATNSSKVGIRSAARNSTRPSNASIRIGSPSCRRARSATAFGIRTARLLPHFITRVLGISNLGRYKVYLSRYI